MKPEQEKPEQRQRDARQRQARTIQAVQDFFAGRRQATRTRDGRRPAGQTTDSRFTSTGAPEQR